jgi:FeS assembly protein IscX
MQLGWTDTLDIAIELTEKFPDTDPMTVSFPQLMEMVMSLDGFTGEEEHCGERILEAIQMAWMDEKD